jgi:hypothetical protein
LLSSLAASSQRVAGGPLDDQVGWRVVSPHGGQDALDRTETRSTRWFSALLEAVAHFFEFVSLRNVPRTNVSRTRRSSLSGR